MNPGSSTEQHVIALPRRERERQQRRADILRAAEAVFAAKGFHAASIEEIAHGAEYGTGTVYLYFQDKEALYVELFESKVHALLELLRQATSETMEPLDALARLVQARMDYFNRNRAFFQIYLREGLSWAGSGDPRWAGVRGLYAEYLDLVARLVQRGQRQGLLRKGDPHQYASALSGMMIQLTRDWLTRQADEPLTRQADFVVNLFLRGAQKD